MNASKVPEVVKGIIHSRLDQKNILKQIANSSDLQSNKAKTSKIGNLQNQASMEYEFKNEVKAPLFKKMLPSIIGHTKVRSLLQSEIQEYSKERKIGITLTEATPKSQLMSKLLEKGPKRRAHSRNFINKSVTARSRRPENDENVVLKLLEKHVPEY